REEAELLGKASFAELSLETKMADSPAQVIDFLEDLVRRVRPTAQQEVEPLRVFAREELGVDDLCAWDVAWAGEKLRKARYDISQEELRPYFPLPRVLQGMFAIFERLYGLRVSETQGPSAWHADVRFFEILDAG